MERFVCESLPSRVIFGSGTLGELADEADRLALRRILVVCTPERRGQGERVAALLGARAIDIFSQARMHTPVQTTELALDRILAGKLHGVVAVGGGSTTGLSKAIALRTDFPQIVIPTTYAGSEVTPILGQTDRGKKTTQRTHKVLPEVVIYDVDLTLELPPLLSLASGMNAIAHASEALYARERNPIIGLLAQEGIKALIDALPKIVANATDKEPRSAALYGAWLCGVCLGTVGMALHHKLCHVLGGSFDLPHAQTHGVVLPHVLAFNLAVEPHARERLQSAMTTSDPAMRLHRLARDFGAPTSLQQLGMPWDGIDRAADLAVENSYWNPRPVDRTSIRELLMRAWIGECPVDG